jgi:hypothetical protein
MIQVVEQDDTAKLTKIDMLDMFGPTSTMRVPWSFSKARRPPLVAMKTQAGGLLRNEII